MNKLIFSIFIIICLLQNSCAKETDLQQSIDTIENIKWTLSKQVESSKKRRTLVPPTLFLDEKKQKAIGTGGCNRYIATYTISGNAISFGPIASTKKLCSKADQSEFHFFNALGKISNYKQNENTLILTGSMEKPLIFSK